ncbi:hypothetical protein D3C76_1257670 [compost metagenome]
MGTAIDLGGFLQAGRNVIEKGDQDNQVKGADQTWQDKRPDRINQMQITDQQIFRNNTAAEKHSDNDQIHKKFTALQFSFGQRISCCDSEKHTQHRCGKRQNNRKDKRADHRIIGKNINVCIPVQFNGENRYFSRSNCPVGTKRHGNHMQKRSQAEQNEQGNKRYIDDIEYPV